MGRLSKWFRKSNRSKSTSNSVRRTHLAVDVLESRIVPTAPPALSPIAVSLGRTLSDSGVRTIATSDFSKDGCISYSGMMDLFNQVEKDGKVSADEFADLRQMVSHSQSWNMPDYVQNLAKKVVDGNRDNANYQTLNSKGNVVTAKLSNLAAGANATQLKQLVNKWFLGMNEPKSEKPYSPAHGSLFGSDNTPDYTDVDQGSLGDCWLLAGLAAAAARQPSLVSSNQMFIRVGSNVVNGQSVDVYAVRWFTSGAANYVTVDTQLPSGGGYYAHVDNRVEWVSLAEKAYAEASGAGLVETMHGDKNEYAVMDFGRPADALSAITGQFEEDVNINPREAARGLQAGELVVLTTDNPDSSKIVGNHCYALVDYNPSSSKPFKVYNPWGPVPSGTYGLFSVNAAFITQNFDFESIAGNSKLSSPTEAPAGPAAIPARATASLTTNGADSKVENQNGSEGGTAVAQHLAMASEAAVCDLVFARLAYQNVADLAFDLDHIS
jgi:Calpain family cysteine protease